MSDRNYELASWA